MKPSLIIMIVGWGVWGFACKVALQKLHPAQLQITAYIVGVLCIPILYFIMKSSPTNTPTNSGGGYGWAILASVCSIAAYLAYLYNLKSGQAGTVSVLASINPLLTFILSVIFLGEAITFIKVIGIISILLGVILVGR